MLRLGAKQKLIVQRRERLFSPNLLRGLALAFAFHLILFLAFKIITPSNTDRNLPITPVAVEVDLGVPQVRNTASPDVTLSPIEEVDLPQYFEMPQPELTAQLRFPPRLGEADFSEIERIEYEIWEDLEDD